MLKYILVRATGFETDIPVFRTAAAIARPHRAHVVFLHIRPDVEHLVVPIASAEFGGGLGVAELIESLERETIVRQERAQRAVQSFCAEVGLSLSRTPMDDSATAEWRVVAGNEVDELVAAGRVSDLIILGRTPNGKSLSNDVVNAALMETGRPILLAPTQPPEQIGRVVAIAWKDTAEAANAVAAALPLLPGAKQVVILSVVEDAPADEAACERLREALAWHNPATAVRHLMRSGDDTASTLLKAAGEVAADLLVMGGYSHSRTREVVFGGVTKRIMQGADLPILLAH